MLHFHTVGMKFNINIRFFDKLGRLVTEKLNVEPGKKMIEVDGPAQYVVESLATNQDE